MRAVKSVDTAPEMAVRRALHAAGLRFRLHRSDLPGRPDVVLPGRRTAVFVHGCFWHSHPGCKRARTPATRRDYWLPKLARNVERDRENLAALAAAGWRTLVVWECDTRTASALERLVADIRATSTLPRTGRQRPHVHPPHVRIGGGGALG